MSSLNIFTIVLVMFAITCEVVCDSETEIFFETNLKEMVDQPLNFVKPLPTWLKGTLIRNGVGRFEVGPRNFTMAVDAYAKLASWRFTGNGSAFFSTQMLYSNCYRDSLKQNTVAPYIILDSVVPQFTPFEKAELMKNGPDNMNVNVIKLINNDNRKEQFVAVSDYWPVYEFNPRNLSTMDRIFAPIPGNAPIGPVVLLSSAHILPEFNSSDYITYASLTSIIPGQKCHLKIVRVKAAGHRELIAELLLDKVSYMHSFGVSKNYAILFAVPFYVNVVGIFKHFSALDAFKWTPEDPTVVYVVHLKTGKIVTLKTETMFFLHVVNSFEISDSEIVVDIAVYKDVSTFRSLELSFLRNKTQRAHSVLPDLKRYIVNIERNTVIIQPIQSLSGFPWAGKLDFPTINENYRFGNYCYVYGVVYNYDDADWFHMVLVKKDVCTGRRDKAWYVKDHYINEAYFVPRPGGLEEDDGILIVPILDNVNKQTNVTIFDAKDLSIISSSVLPTNIPFGTHGKYFDDLF